MNKNIFIIATLLVGILSCGKTYNVHIELHKILINKTAKHLLYLVKTINSSDSMYSIGNDSIYLNFVENETVKRSGLAFDKVSRPAIYMRSEELYNLTDTTKIFRAMPFSDWNKSDSLYFSKIQGSEWLGQDVFFSGYENRLKLIFTDTLLPIMQKDTSMLTKFKDYYNK